MHHHRHANSYMESEFGDVCVEGIRWLRSKMIDVLLLQWEEAHGVRCLRIVREERYVLDGRCSRTRQAHVPPPSDPRRSHPYNVSPPPKASTAYRCLLSWLPFEKRATRWWEKQTLTAVRTPPSDAHPLGSPIISVP